MLQEMRLVVPPVSPSCRAAWFLSREDRMDSDEANGLI